MNKLKLTSAEFEISHYETFQKFSNGCAKWLTKEQHEEKIPELKSLTLKDQLDYFLSNNNKIIKRDYFDYPSEENMENSTIKVINVSYKFKKTNYQRDVYCPDGEDIEEIIQSISWDNYLKFNCPSKLEISIYAKLFEE